MNKLKIDILKQGVHMKKIITLAIASLVTGTAMANEPGKTDTGIDYNKIEVNYIAATISNSTWDGYYTSGSFLVSENVFLLVNFATISRLGATREKTNIGLGYRFPVGSSADLFSTLTYYSQTNDFSQTNNYSVTTKTTNEGGNWGLGVRSKLSADADASAVYNYISAGSQTYNNYTISLKYNVTESIFATGGYTWQTGSSSATAYLVGAGVRF